MPALEHEELRVVVPVGFMLSEPRELTVSVDRPGQAPLPVRLRLIPALVREPAAAGAEPVPVSAPPALTLRWPNRANPADFDDGYTEFGGGD